MRLFFLLVFVLVFSFNPLCATASVKIFDTKEIESVNLKPFFKWTGMLDRFRTKLSLQENCTPSATKKCHVKEWRDFLSSLKDKDISIKLREVNKYMNEAEYILDIINWGVQDYWATPFQFFVKDGDCEDYAIAKYMSLKELGVSENDMRIVVLQDNNLGVMHAVLAVLTGDEALILDNQISQVVSANKIHHYSPIYSINEHHWWRHSKN